MKSYNIILKKCNKYSAVIYSVSYNNPIQDIVQISNELSQYFDSPCYMLFDLLLSNGDEFNRFAEGYFDGKDIKLDSINIIEIEDKKHLKMINEFYKMNRQLLGSSILSSSEKLKYARM